MGTLWGRQPVLILALVNSAIALAVGFGAHITMQQFGLLMAFTNTVLALLTNTQVTPMATLPDHVAAAVTNASNADVPKVALASVLPAPVITGSTITIKEQK
jgi:hypothetical protein